jgi:hypothetical protein
MVENEPLYTNVDVLSSKSDYFKGMFRSNMRENIDRVVTVPDCSKVDFLQVLEYLCLDDFTVNVDHAVELWHLADMYLLEGLKLCILGALERGLCKGNVCKILQEAEGLNYECDELKRICVDYFKYHFCWLNILDFQSNFVCILDIVWKISNNRV